MGRGRDIDRVPRERAAQHGSHVHFLDAHFCNWDTRNLVQKLLLVFPLYKLLHDTASATSQEKQFRFPGK